jgi:hypothetical protein
MTMPLASLLHALLTWPAHWSASGILSGTRNNAVPPVAVYFLLLATLDVSDSCALSRSLEVIVAACACTWKKKDAGYDREARLKGGKTLMY